MLDLPPLRDVVSRLTHYVEGSVEHLYWGSMMRHVPGLKQLSMSISVDLRLDFRPSGGGCGAANTSIRVRRFRGTRPADLALGRGASRTHLMENKYSVTNV